MVGDGSRFVEMSEEGEGLPRYKLVVKEWSEGS